MRALRRGAVRLLAALALAVPPTLAAAPPTHANLASTAQIATWAAARGGSSACRNLGTASVHCDHGYSSYDLATGLQTCSELGLRAVGVTTCEATLGGFTRGPGRAVNETVAACSTTALKTLTFHFGGASGAYPAFEVSGAVEAGHGTFSGTSEPLLIPGVGLVVQSASGTFTLGCGPSRPGGSFSGSWTLTVV